MYTTTTGPFTGLRWYDRGRDDASVMLLLLLLQADNKPRERERMRMRMSLFWVNLKVEVWGGIKVGGLGRWMAMSPIDGVEVVDWYEVDDDMKSVLSRSLLCARGGMCVCGWWVCFIPFSFALAVHCIQWEYVGSTNTDASALFFLPVGPCWTCRQIFIPQGVRGGGRGGGLDVWIDWWCTARTSSGVHTPSGTHLDYSCSKRQTKSRVTMKKGSAAARDKENDNTKGFLSTEDDDDDDEDEDNENNDDELRNNDDAHSSSSSIHAHTHKQNKLRRELLYIKAHVVLTQHKQTMIKIRREWGRKEGRKEQNKERERRRREEKTRSASDTLCMCVCARVYVMMLLFSIPFVCGWVVGWLVDVLRSACGSKKRIYRGTKCVYKKRTRECGAAPFFCISGHWSGGNQSRIAELVLSYQPEPRNTMIDPLNWRADCSSSSIDVLYVRTQTRKAEAQDQEEIVKEAVREC